MEILAPNTLSWDPLQSSPRVLLRQAVSVKPLLIFGSKQRSREIEHTHLRLLSDFRTIPSLSMTASSRDPPGLTQEVNNVEVTENGSDLFEDMKHRFLSFKAHKYMKNIEYYEQLANGQAPKFLVIACADSRVCPTAILGFQPGEAFMVRNIANLVPSFEKEPTETHAALEFAVNALKVENVLVIGHSCCGGIRALMSMDDGADSRGFIQNWVSHGKKAKLKTKADACDVGFDQQCKHCEKESVNRSLVNLLSYPWIEEKVKEGVLSLHGGYYDFVDCTFEKWTLDYKDCCLEEEDERISVKDRSFWR